MRHQHGVAKLNRTGSHKRAMLRNMAVSLFKHERIVTTKAKAKALRPFVERLITLGKRGDLHARRLAARHVRDHAVLQKLFDELASRFEAREGGYTRILKLGPRRGDQATQAMIELVDSKVDTKSASDDTDDSDQAA